jgi:hypothetical protein
LFSAATNIIITDLVEFFLVFSVNWLAFGVEHGVRGNNTKLFGFSSDNFKLYRSEASPYQEQIALFDWSVGILEVGYEISFCEISLQALNGI